MRVLHAPLLFTFQNVGAKVSASTEKKKKKKISAMEIITWDCKLKLQSCIATSWSLLYLD